MKELEGGVVPRGKEGVSTRIGECMETLEHYVLKVTEGVKSGRERKSTSMEFLQIEEAEPVMGLVHAFGLGPTYEDQGSRQAQWWNLGLGEGCDVDLSVARDQGAILKASERESPHLLGPAGVTSSPHHKGLRKSPIEGPLIRGHQNNPISSARAPKQHKESTSFKIREEGGRRDDQGNDFEAHSLMDDAPKYEEFNFENSPSSLIFVFGRPLLYGGSSGQGGYLESNEVVDLEPLRMVAMDGSEWGLESLGALVVLEEASVGAKQQVEEAISVASEVSGYEKWEDSCRVKFRKFLGFPMGASKVRLWICSERWWQSSIKWKIRGLSQCPDVSRN